jgi:hypothetical protein
VSEELVADPSPDGGLNFNFPWQFLEYAVTAIVAATGGILGWVWKMSAKLDKTAAIAGVDMPANLADRVSKLETTMGFNERRDDERHAENIKRFESNAQRLNHLNDTISDLRAEIPNRGFVEAQLDAAVQKITEAVKNHPTKI